jgi:hypothetical protein
MDLERPPPAAVDLEPVVVLLPMREPGRIACRPGKYNPNLYTKQRGEGETAIRWGGRRTMKLLNGLSLQTYLGIEPPLIRYHLARQATAASFLLNFKVVMGLEVQPKVLADARQAE